MRQDYIDLANSLFQYSLYPRTKAASKFNSNTTTEAQTMEYKNFTTFNVDIDNSIAWVTFDFPPVNVQGQEMLADLSSLALRLERDRTVKVVVF
ncbi:hypothetical protein ACPV5V_24595, partial [Vibrio campbellii]